MGIEHVDFLREMGLPAPVISEWDRLRLGHSGPQQPVHTAMVALTAHFMRQRGYHIFSESGGWQG